MSIDQRRLNDLTAEVDQLHHESMRSFRETAEEIHFGEPAEELRASRRELFKKAGAGAGLLTVAAIAGPLSSFMPAAAQADELSDAEIVQFAAGLEFAAVAAYQTIIDSDRLDASVLRTARTFQSHHREHGRAFNAITKATSEKPNSEVLATFSPRLEAATNQNALLDVAFDIEEVAAATYLSVLGTLQDKTNAQATATILPIESQHAVVLGQVLDKRVIEYMPPFQNSRLALDPADYSS